MVKITLQHRELSAQPASAKKIRKGTNEQDILKVLLDERWPNSTFMEVAELRHLTKISKSVTAVKQQLQTYEQVRRTIDSL